MSGAAPRSELIAAGCVAMGTGPDRRGLLITGPSGVGKSSLALHLVALGAELVSDDRTCLSLAGAGDLLASAPDAIAGLIESRELGLLRVTAGAPAPVRWVVELSPNGHPAPPRCPEPRVAHLLGCAIPLLSCRESSATACALAALLRGGELVDPGQSVAEISERRDDGGGGG